MSFIDTDGRFPRFLTRAQKWAITNESAPSSSKKWASTGTRSTPRTPASSSAKMLSVRGAAAPRRGSITVDPGGIVDSAGRVLRFGDAPRALRAISPNSSHDLVEEIRQAQVLAGCNRLVVHPLSDRQVEYPHAEGREDDRTAAIEGSAFEHDVGERTRHEAPVSRLLLGEMGRGVRLHDVLDVVHHVLRTEEDLGCEIVRCRSRRQALSLNFSLSRGSRSYSRTSSIAHTVSIRNS